MQTPTTRTSSDSSNSEHPDLSSRGLAADCAPRADALAPQSGAVSHFAARHVLPVSTSKDQVPIDLAVTAQWEGVHKSAPPLSAGAELRMHNREDELMRTASPDGRPPSHAQRVVGRWVIFSAGALVVAALGTWALISSNSLTESVWWVMAFLLALGIGGWPVYVAQAGRRKDRARVQAQAEAEAMPMSQTTKLVTVGPMPNGVRDPD